MQVKKNIKPMWESEKKLIRLTYRNVETQSNEFEKKVSVKDIEHKEKLSGAATVENVIALLEDTKYHYLQYNIIFLKKIENIYPKLYNYLENIINNLVRDIDKAINEWKSSKNDETLLSKITTLFIKESDQPLRKATDSGQPVTVPSFTLVHLNLCIVLLDYLLMTDELLLYNIKSIKPLKKMKNVMKEKPVHVPSEQFNVKSLNKSKLQSYESYALESKTIFDEFKNSVRKMHDFTSFLMVEFKKTHKLLSKIEELREAPQKDFDENEWKKFKNENGIDYAKFIVSSISEYSVEDGSHLSELKYMFQTVLDEFEKLKISNTEASTVSELKESIKDDEKELKRLKSEETVSELSEYIASFSAVSQFPMRMKNLLEKYYKTINTGATDDNGSMGASTGATDDNGSMGASTQSIELVLRELESKLDFCYKERINYEFDANNCKEKLEKTLGVKLDKNIVLYPECELKKCSIENKRGECFNGKRLIKCGKTAESKKYSSTESDELTPLIEN